MRKEETMLGDTNVQPMLPVKDLKAAKKFYEKTLGLEPVEDMPDSATTYRSGKTNLVVYRSEFAGTNKGTAALWEVADVRATVKDLKGKGVSFEHYDDMPGMTRDGDIHRAGPMEVAWFKDPSGNILSVQNHPAHP
jgi:catechol 2,3-dioxygenase-like lactoylglutathione lyase family enzyme